MASTFLDEDFNHILDSTANLWKELKDQRIFVTGATGFFGMWVLESFLRANKKFKLNASLVALSRDPEQFKSQFPHIGNDPTISFVKGDIRTFEFPTGEFSHILHLAATAAKETFNNQDALVKFDIIANGTRRALEFAVACKAKKFLYTSSAVVYGKQPENLTHIPEDYNGAPDPTNFTTYAANLGMSKRTAEFFCAYFANKFGIEVKIARCFTFVGPGLPLDVHYAIGNFIKDSLAGGPINILSDGTARRSYLYVSDLMIWLWTILFKGDSSRPYNVGSEEDVSVEELAHKVAENFETKIDINVAKSPTPGSIPDKQVPSTQRAQKELGLKQTIDLKEAIAKTVKYYQT